MVYWSTLVEAAMVHLTLFYKEKGCSGIVTTFPSFSARRSGLGTRKYVGAFAFGTVSLERMWRGTLSCREVQGGIPCSVTTKCSFMALSNFITVALDIFHYPSSDIMKAILIALSTLRAV